MFDMKPNAKKSSPKKTQTVKPVVEKPVELTQEEKDMREADVETDMLGKIVAIVLIVIFAAWIAVITPAIINYFRGYP